MVDIVRQKTTRFQLPRHTVLILVGVCLVGLITYVVTRLKPASASVQRSTLYFDTVKRGPMLRQVRGVGTLVPEDVRVVAAATEGRVERILVQPGEEVSTGTVLVELSNPQLQQAALDSSYQIKAAEAELNNLRVKLDSERMSQQSLTANVQSEYRQAKIQLDTDEKLATEGLVSTLTLRQSRIKVEELENRLCVEQERLKISSQAKKAQLDAQQARIEQLRALARLNQEQVASLRVLAATNGVLQQISVEVGQQITPGTNLARVADPTTLKAALQIAETQTKDIQIGQAAQIDLRSGTVLTGRVKRIDPASRNSLVTVDIEFSEPLPQAARPDLGVDGTIELERLDNVLYVGRPASGAAQSTISLFRVEPNGHSAVRVPVRLGRNSVNTVEILDGLREGDEVILSDMSQWDNANQIKLN